MDWISGSPLPPLEEGNVITDWDNVFDEVEFKCLKCPEVRMTTSDQLQDHKKWHERINTLFHLRRLTQTIITTPFGHPGGIQCGTLVRLEPGRYGREFRDTGNAEKDIKWCMEDGRLVAGIRYIDGQKYTFGQEFISREEQGEFIFLLLEDFDINHSEVSNCLQNYFQLETRDDGLWIQAVPQHIYHKNTNEDGGHHEHENCPGRSQIHILINGKKLSTLSPCREVMFGDVITIEEANGGKYCDLVFTVNSVLGDYDDDTYTLNLDAEKKEIEITEVTKEVAEDPSIWAESPFNNELIVHTILSLLPIRQIKNCRLVCPRWSEVGIQIMKKRVYVEIDEGRCRLIAQCQLFFSFAHDLAHHQIPAWRISLLPQHYFNTTKVGTRLLYNEWILRNPELVASKQKKLLSDLEWFFSFSHNVTTLAITIETNAYAADLQVILVILNGVSSTLKELELEIYRRIVPKIDRYNHRQYSVLHWLCGCNLPTNLNLTPLEEMKQLKQLTLCMHSDFLEFGETYLLPGFTQIQTLNLSCWSETDEAISLLRKISDGMKESNGTPALRRLSSIDLNYTSGYDFLGFDVIEALESFPPSRLKILNLVTLAVDIALTRHINHFETILENQASTLEELELLFVIQEGLHPLKFPKRMTNLKKLTICLLNWGNPFPSLSSLSFGTGISKINYKDGYPRLSEVKLVPWYYDAWDWNQFFPILSLFLPSSQVSSSCTKVEVPFHLKHKYHSCLEDLETIFPNATFPPELQAARDLPLYVEGEEDEEENDEDEEETDDEDEVETEEETEDEAEVETEDEDGEVEIETEEAEDEDGEVEIETEEAEDEDEEDETEETEETEDEDGEVEIEAEDEDEEDETEEAEDEEDETEEAEDEDEEDETEEDEDEEDETEEAEDEDEEDETEDVEDDEGSEEDED